MEETYTYEIKMRVHVTAMEKSDAQDVIDDLFGTGEDGMVYVESVAVKEIKRKA